MPPRREKSSATQLQELIYDHGIRFEGFVPPRKWPEEQKHHFQIIRKIEGVRYDDYKIDKDIPQARKTNFKDRVNYLRQRAYDLLYDDRTNETTWREFEQPILQRFDENVICDNCNDELWESDYQAQFMKAEDQILLNEKRQARKMCRCRRKRVATKTIDNDHENCGIFCFKKEELLTHAPGDNLPNLHNLSISMKPDRLVGLRPPSRMLRHLSYFPVAGKRILLPFLVVEAKKEYNAPGFCAIQYQTAFAVRRLLKAQNDLWSRDQSSEPCLVWFFAYQGEQWRLHACTYKDERVRMYDLWQGTIQSQDGALQLLLIVDFIWSWSRDIYRPTLRKLFLSFDSNFRDQSPASTNRFRQSVSLSSTTSPAPTAHDPDVMEVDENETESERSRTRTQQVVHGYQRTPEQDSTVIRDTSFYSSLKSGISLSKAPFRTQYGVMQHSDVVRFKCYIHTINTAKQLDRERINANNHAIFKDLPLNTFLLHDSQLRELGALWTDTWPEVVKSTKLRPVSLFFQTNFDQSTWQIFRTLHCIIWNFESQAILTKAKFEQQPSQVGIDNLQEDIAMKDLNELLLSVQRIHGRESFWYASRGLSMQVVLQPRHGNRSLEWKQFNEIEVPEKTSRILQHPGIDAEIGGFSVASQMICSRLAEIQGSAERRPKLTIPELIPDQGEGDSILAIRPLFWSQTCPRFCLFIMAEIEPGDKAAPLRFLLQAKSLGKFYCIGDARFDRSDWKILRNWCKVLELT